MHSPLARAWLVGLAVASIVDATLQAQLQSSEMRQLADKAGFGPQVVRWCPVDPAAGHARVYAVAVANVSGGRGGRYLVLDPDGSVTPLATYAGDVDLSCYPRERADELAAAIKGSDTIEGELTPRWSATVVCAFTESTEAHCWQFDPGSRRYVEVGHWRT